MLFEPARFSAADGIRGRRLDEAMNPLTLLASGIYGKPLPKQLGAPVRIVTPWKYGYKSIKSIVKIEFVRNQPSSFWETLAPDEYPFESNVNPKVPHPRWSQATERMIDTGDRVRTQPFNGYGPYVDCAAGTRVVDKPHQFVTIARPNLERVTINYAEHQVRRTPDAQ
jgi:hypothetical protein